MIARLATGLKKLPSEIRAMPFREARQVLDYWAERPPEHEMLVMLAMEHLGWRPASKPLTEAEVIAAHRASLEARWKGGAMNAKQLYDAYGGRAISADGTAGAPITGGNLPGIGPFPGAH